MLTLILRAWARVGTFCVMKCRDVVSSPSKKSRSQGSVVRPPGRARDAQKEPSDPVISQGPRPHFFLMMTAPLFCLGCGIDAPLTAPVEIRATSAIAATGLPTTKVRVVLGRYGPSPDALHVMSRNQGGFSVELECGISDRGAFDCEGDIVARGENQVTVTYRAIDGRRESVTQHLSLHGDEEEITLRGSFDNDASLRGLVPSIYRAADSRVVLEVVAPPPSPGQLPSFLLTNGTAADIVIMGQAHLLGTTVRVSEDGRWERARRARVGGCGTGVGPATVTPGMSMPAGEIYAIGGSVPFSRGSYLFIVEFDDSETLADENVSRRITARFEVTDEPPADLLLERADAFLDGAIAPREEPDLWAGATPPPRPGLARPAGREGSRRGGTVRLLVDGEDIAGALSQERSRHTYHLDVEPGQEGVVRIFARCVEAPCSARVGMYSGREGGVGWHSRTLHRDPPTWSFREHTVHHRDEAFIIGCREECDAGWEFYGRVHIREIPADER